MTIRSDLGQHKVSHSVDSCQIVATATTEKTLHLGKTDLQMNDSLADILGNEHVSKSFNLFLIHGFAQVLLGLDGLLRAQGKIA